MDIKVSQLTQVSQVQQVPKEVPADGSFKFTLASRVEEQELQARLTALMEEITMQGKKLGEYSFSKQRILRLKCPDFRM